ncbi:MAG: hypothetical protein ACYDDQ_00010 [Vulcanimicrobiaceae bacterium]
MIPTTDGSAAKALFAHIEPKTAVALRNVLAAAIAKASELGALAVSEKQGAILTTVQENAAPIESTALDAAAHALAAHFPPGVPNIGAALAAATIGSIAAGASISKARGEMYHASSVLGDVEAVASGNPEKVIRRAAQHVFWRAFGNAGRSIFRRIGGKR